MSKFKIKVSIVIIIFQLIIISNLLLLNSSAAVKDFEPEFSWAPEIDGDIDKSANEWENASKEEILLGSESDTNVGLLIDLWVLQNGSDLYILVQFELESLARNAEEFVGILISETDSESIFFDAKIIQFSGLGGPSEDFVYLDYFIQNDVYYRDSEINGDGAAELHGDNIIYEFQIPINDSDGEDNKDVALDFGDEYAFKIIYGEGNFYPDSIKLSNTVMIEIQYPKKSGPGFWENVNFILSIIFFSAIGVLFGFYSYKIVVIKKKIKRIKRG